MPLNLVLERVDTVYSMGEPPVDSYTYTLFSIARLIHDCCGCVFRVNEVQPGGGTTSVLLSWTPRDKGWTLMLIGPRTRFRAPLLRI